MPDPEHHECPVCGCDCEKAIREARRGAALTEERLAAVLRGTNLVPFDDAGEWAATLMKRMESSDAD